MEHRGDRRDRTLRYATRARRVWLRAMCPIGFEAHPVGRFAKGKAIGCGCRRVQRGLSPKIPGSMCHMGDHGYHPCVMERIAGKRLTKAWLRELRGGFDALDIEL